MAQQNCCPGTCPGSDCFKEAVCIDTQRIYDSCGDKECIEGLQVYFFGDDQDVIDHALIVKAKKVEIVHTFIEVEPVPFDNGFFSVDITYFFKVTLAIYNCPTAVPTIVHGLATFTKKVILFGSEGSVRTFTSEACADNNKHHHGEGSTLPCATVQVVDPLVLASRVEDAPTPPRGCNCVCPPPCVSNHFKGCFNSCNEPRKIVTVTLGIFSIIQLSRRVQLLMPAFDFCVPCKDCSSVVAPLMIHASSLRRSSSQLMSSSHLSCSKKDAVASAAVYRRSGCRPPIGVRKGRVLVFAPFNGTGIHNLL